MPSWRITSWALRDPKSVYRDGAAICVLHRAHHSHRRSPPCLLPRSQFVSGVRDRYPVLCLGARSGSSALNPCARCATRGLRQAPPRARSARPAVSAAPRGVPGAIVRARLRHRRDAPHTPAGAFEHPQTPAGPRERVQSRPAHAAAVRPRYATRLPRAAPRPLASFTSPSSCHRLDGREHVPDTCPMPSECRDVSFRVGNGTMTGAPSTTGC